MGLICLDVATAALGQGKKQGREWAFLCPFHDDHDPSLKINPEKNLWKCFACGRGGSAWELAANLADCSPDDKKKVAAWLREHGLSNANGGAGRKVVAEYVYRDATGNPVFKVVRYHPKDFLQFRYDSKNDKWLSGLKDEDDNLLVELVPYRLPEVIRAKCVFICEGEKDCDNLAKLGFVASTNAMGAGNWRDEYSPWFAGKRVVVVPDNDDLGREHARKVARSLFGIAEWVKILELPGLPHKGDISDWLKPGHTKEETIEHEGRVN